MVSVFMLYAELLLDAIGLLTGVFVLCRSQDNMMRKSWGLLTVTLSLLLFVDNAGWLACFSRNPGMTSCVVPMLMQPLSLRYIVRTIVFFQLFSLFPIASVRPGWLTSARIVCLCLPALAVLCIAGCYEVFDGHITLLRDFGDIARYSDRIDVRLRMTLFAVSLLAPGVNFLFLLLRRWIPFRRKLGKGLRFYLICFGVIMFGYVWLMLGTSHLSFNVFGYLIIVPAICLNYFYLRDENPLSLPVPDAAETDSEQKGAIAEIEVSPAVLELCARLETYMKEVKPFTASDFSIGVMLCDLQTNEYRLNKALRYAGFSGFREYVNYTRLQYFKQQAALNSAQTVKELMFGSGFSSRSSFYRYFSTLENISPSEYLERLRREFPPPSELDP